MKPSVLLNVVLAVALVVVSARLMSSGGETAGKPVADSADVVYGNIMGRTSVRSYLDKPVEDSKIEKLLHAGMAAPTAVNTQPWHFVVIRQNSRTDTQCRHGKRGPAGYRGVWQYGKREGGYSAHVLDARRVGCHGKHSFAGTCHGAWCGVDRHIS